MLNKLTIIYYFIIITCLTGCSSTKVQVYLRDDVKSDKSNIVAFPALLLNNNGSISPENTEYSNLLIDGIFSKKWSESSKEGTVYPVPKKVLDGIPNAYKALDTVITNFDSQKFLISLLLPGSCCPKSLDGIPSITTPLAW